jgi:hypothetical protein
MNGEQKLKPQIHANERKSLKRLGTVAKDNGKQWIPASAGMTNSGDSHAKTLRKQKNRNGQGHIQKEKH